MKTKNNVQKTNGKSTGVAATIFAIALAISNLSFASGNTMNALNAILEEEIENTLELENWMTNETNFYASVSVDVESEKVLDMEEWMVAENNFFSEMNIENSSEETMEMEDWMVDEKVFEAKIENRKKTENSSENVKPKTTQKKFGTRTFIVKEQKDPELKIERWMLDYRYWN